MQFGYWIARHGSLPITKSLAAFGGTHPGLGFYAPAFHPVGNAIVPQFMAGLPMTLAGATWAGGIGLAVAAGAVLGACGVLALGGLIARLAGPRWAPLGALALALALPEQFTSRSTYSEPLAQVLFLGGLCLIIDSLGPDGAGRRGMAAIAGLASGLTLLVRIDGASDLLPLIPYCGLLLLGRRPQALPLIGGVAAGAAYGVIDGVILSRPYLTAIKGSLLPLAAVAGLLLAVTAVAVAARWRRGVPDVAGTWLAVAVTAGLVIRPYLQTVHGQRTSSDIRAMTGYQRLDHLPVDPTRLYYEISLHWVFWYIGIPAVVLATLGAAILARRCLQGRAPAWTLPLLTFAWIIVSTLLRPGITPDQPWASRRLVPGVLPGFILLAVWAASWLAGWRRRHGPGRGAAAARRDHHRRDLRAPRRPGRRPPHRHRAGRQDHLRGRGCRGARAVRGHPGQRLGRHDQPGDGRPVRPGRPRDVRRPGGQHAPADDGDHARRPQGHPPGRPPPGAAGPAGRRAGPLLGRAAPPDPGPAHPGRRARPDAAAAAHPEPDRGGLDGTARPLSGRV
jgi:hypothetical protein